MERQPHSGRSPPRVNAQLLGPQRARLHFTGKCFCSGPGGQHFCGRSQMFFPPLDRTLGGSFRGCGQFLSAASNPRGEGPQLRAGRHRPWQARPPPRTRGPRTEPTPAPWRTRLPSSVPGAFRGHGQGRGQEGSGAGRRAELPRLHGAGGGGQGARVRSAVPLPRQRQTPGLREPRAATRSEQLQKLLALPSHGSRRPLQLRANAVPVCAGGPGAHGEKGLIPSHAAVPLLARSAEPFAPWQSSRGHLNPWSWQGSPSTGPSREMSPLHPPPPCPMLKEAASPGPRAGRARPGLPPTQPLLPVGSPGPRGPPGRLLCP